MRTFLAALGSIAISVAAQFALKAGVSEANSSNPESMLSSHGLLHVFFNPWVLFGFFLYGTGAVLWLAVLTNWEVSKAYPLVGLGFVATAAVGFLAGEQVSPLRVLGVISIALGVLMISRT